MLGLRKTISKELLSRVDQYQSLEQVSEAANKFESQFPPTGRANRADNHALASGVFADEEGNVVEVDWAVEANPGCAATIVAS